MSSTLVTAYGVIMPRLLYGTAWKKARTAEFVAAAIAQGFRGIDTACQPKHYDEAGVGAGIAAGGVARAQLYLQTKFTPLSGQDPQQLPYDPRAALSTQVAQSAAVSLANLRTSYLDALVLHSPLARAAELREVWQAMETLVDTGAVRQLGISNCYRLAQLESLFATARIKPAVLQNRFYAKSGYDQDVRAFCRAHRVVYQSFWTLSANPALLADACLVGPAARLARTPAQILFRYLTQIEVVPLTGTTSLEHMREDLAIFEFELSADDCAGIDRRLYG